MTASSWSAQLADAVAASLDTTITDFTVHSTRPVGDDVLEMVFSVSFDTHMRGIRVDRTTFEIATGRMMNLSLDEIAFNVVELGIFEPRSIDAFRAADATGVHWLRIAEWLEEIS